ncbi:TetR/AcrR family transcriptional regulator [bacterium]|nr:TetR/AcrR family transcriptional regulator [bacterium]
MVTDKRATILEAAKRLFIRFGKRKTSVDEIARAAGVGKGTVYSYFKGKELLWQILIDTEVGNLFNAIRRAVDDVESAAAKIRAFVITRVRFIREVLELISLDQSILDEMLPEIIELREKVLAWEKELIAEIIDYGIRRGEFREIGVDLLSMAFIAALRGLEIPWIWERRLVGVEESAEALLNVMFNGLLATPGAAT